MLHLHNAKERDWCQLDVSVLGIEYWYCTVQRVLVLPQQCIVEHEPRRPSSLKAKEGSLLLGALTICLKALTVKTYQAV